MPKLGPEYDDPRGVAGRTATGAIAVAARGTEDKALAGFDILLGQARLPFENPDREDISIDADGIVLGGCGKIPGFEPSANLSDAEIKRLWTMTGSYSTPGFDGTPCLFKMAWAIQGSLYAIAGKNPALYFKFLNRLVDIRDELAARTQKPYRIAFDTRDRKPLPQKFLDLDPFSDYKKWTETLAAHKKGNAVILEPIPVIEATDPISEQESLQDKLNASLERLDLAIVNMQLFQRGLDATPAVKKAIARLSGVTLGKIRMQTGVVVNPAFENQPVIKQTEVILYHSVYSVVLDAIGEPYTLAGRFDYPILVPPPGSVMERHLEPPGLYLSVRRYGDGSFRLDDDTIKKLLFGGIGGFVENHGGGIRTPHEFQEKIQAYLINLGYAYAASIVVPSAFQRQDISIDLLEEKFPELAETVVPYMVREIEKLGRQDYKNWEELAKNIGKTIVIEKVKEKIRNYLIKKIGAKVIPLINLASTAYDLFEGEAERMRVRHAIACIIMHVKGSAPDDLHIAAKVLAKILADKFHDAIIGAVTSKAADLGMKAVKRGKKDKKLPEEETAGESTPYEQEKSDDNDLSKELDPRKPSTEPQAGEASDSSGTGANPSNRGYDHQAIALELQAGRDLANRLQSAQAQSHPEAPQAAVSTGSQSSPAASSHPKKLEEEEATAFTLLEQKQKPKNKPGKDTGEEEEASQLKSQKKPKAKQDEPSDDSKGIKERGTHDKGTDEKKEARKKAKKKRERLKKIGVMARLKKKWGDNAAIILRAISQRDHLRAAWGNVAPNLFAHHLVPVVVLKNNEVAQAAVIGGFEFNGKKNGRLLNITEHAGGHDEYNEIISSEMNEWAKTKSKEKGSYTPEEARKFIESRISHWSDMYVQSQEIRPRQPGPGSPDIEPDDTEPDD
ncbi:AHH domain-containing protein [Methylosarcina fibrata]|uniref:AHH domain-containing protein n=1 Tax=Methylosarcina fibrata TaxID=105972 RepID=UPI0003A33098|nr:AHH domain-containing protein [Methylosarcina fibrata]